MRKKKFEKKSKLYGLSSVKNGTIASAAAQVAIKSILNFFLGGIRMLR